MKKIFSCLFLIIVFSFYGCKTTIDNRVSFKNSSETNLIINFRGQEIKVDIGQKADVNEIPKGTYSYDTNFSIPPNATTKSTFGDVSGTVIINAETKILVIYTSTTINGVFTLSATLSSSDDQGNPTSP